MSTETLQHLSPCGAARLLSAIDNTHSLEHYLERMGVAVAHCGNCGVLLDKYAQRHVAYQEHGLCHECWLAQKTVMVVCSECGVLFPRSAKYMKHQAKDGCKYAFCGQICKGKWTGKHYGFGTHDRCYDYETIWQAHLETGRGASRLARALNMPIRSVSRILQVCRKNEMKSIKIK